jgi:hypothetical protein
MVRGRSHRPAGKSKNPNGRLTRLIRGLSSAPDAQRLLVPGRFIRAGLNRGRKTATHVRSAIWSSLLATRLLCIPGKSDRDQRRAPSRRSKSRYPDPRTADAKIGRPIRKPVATSILTGGNRLLRLYCGKSRYQKGRGWNDDAATRQLPWRSLRCRQRRSFSRSLQAC